MGLFVKEVEYFGLDIGSTAIRLVQLRGGTEHPALVAYGSVLVPGNISASDSQMDHDKLAELVAQLVRENQVPLKDVVVGLSASKVFATVITTPKLPDDQLAKAIKYQAEQYIPMALDQVKLDWTVVDTSKDGKSYEVLLVAAPISAVEKYVHILEKAGLEPLALEANAAAVARAFVGNAQTAAAIVDFGSLDSDISIVWNNAPRLIRSVPVGGLTMVKSVAQSLGLDDVQAAQFTYKFGLTQSKLEGQVFKALKPSLETLVSEVQKSIKYFAGRYPEVKLEKLIITGGASVLPELGLFLANSTGLPVEFGNAWSRVSYPAGLQDKLLGMSPEYAAAVGLAGRGYMS